MKKLLAILIMACITSSPVLAAEKKAPAKKPAVHKEIKHHKKVDGDKIPTKK
jgi:hypothetical protein